MIIDNHHSVLSRSGRLFKFVSRCRKNGEMLYSNIPAWPERTIRENLQISVLYRTALSGGAGCSAKSSQLKDGLQLLFRSRQRVGERLGSEQTGITVNNRVQTENLPFAPAASPRLALEGPLDDRVVG
jgi:hypothetical protein